MYTFISNTRGESSSSYMSRLRILINNLVMSQRFHLGEVVVVKEESGPTSSGNAKQGEIQGIYKDCHILPVKVHPLFHCSRRRCSECAGTLQATNHSQVLETIPPIIILNAK